MAWFNTDDELEAEAASPKPRLSLGQRSTPVAVAACCAAVALPFGDASDGTNFLFAPLAAAGVTFLISWRFRPSWAASLSVVAAVLTLVFMLLAVIVVIALFGI